VVSIERKELPQLSQYPYVVAVKTNGVRYLCVITTYQKQHGFLFINRSGEGFWKPSSLPIPQSMVEETIWDGEWVPIFQKQEEKKENNALSNVRYEFQIFDVLRVNDQAVFLFDYVKRLSVVQHQLESWRTFIYSSSSSNQDPLKQAQVLIPRSLKTNTKTLDELRLWEPLDYIENAGIGFRVKEVFHLFQVRFVLEEWIPLLPFSTDGLILTRENDPYISAQSLHSFKVK